jgi:hypothetical protein
MLTGARVQTVRQLAVGGVSIFFILCLVPSINPPRSRLVCGVVSLLLLLSWIAGVVSSHLSALCSESWIECASWLLLTLTVATFFVLTGGPSETWHALRAAIQALSAP